MTASNPLLSQADARLIYQALKGLDLLVVVDLYRTPTGMLADYLLPAAGGLERPVLQTNAGTANLIYGGPQAIDPLYERRVDFDFWRDWGHGWDRSRTGPGRPLMRVWMRCFFPRNFLGGVLCRGRPVLSAAGLS